MTRCKRARHSRYLVVFLLAFLAYHTGPAALLAQDESTGTFGASYLKIPVGATLMSVPDIVAEMDPDGSLAFSNPAASARLANGHLFFSRAAWLDELSLNAASVVFPIPRYDLGLSFATRLLHAGDLQGYNSANEVVSRESYYGLGFSGAVSKHFRSLGLSLGVGMTYMREHLPAEDGNGVAMSFGASFTRGAHHASAFAQDVGGEISFEGRDYPVDGRFVFGYGYGFRQQWGLLDVGAQMVVSRSDLRRVQLGAVYHLPRFFVLRGGLDRVFDGPDTARLPLSAGFGLRYGDFMLDYAYTPQEYFENTHTFSVGVSFGAAGHARKGAGPLYDTAGSPPREPNAPQSPASAEPVSTNTATAPVGPGVTGQTTYAIVAGSHGRLESAESEVRALSLVKVPAKVETDRDGYVVVVDRFASQTEAKKALKSYENRGHRFEIRPEPH